MCLWNGFNCSVDEYIKTEVRPPGAPASMHDVAPRYRPSCQLVEDLMGPCHFPFTIGRPRRTPPTQTSGELHVLPWLPGSMSCARRANHSQRKVAALSDGCTVDSILSAATASAMSLLAPDSSKNRVNDATSSVRLKDDLVVAWVHWAGATLDAGVSATASTRGMLDSAGAQGTPDSAGAWLPERSMSSAASAMSLLLCSFERGLDVGCWAAGAASGN